MKPNVWNIKDILNTPTTSMSTKSGKGGATTDYSCLTDSQFQFGSQFWPENSQSFSQEICGRSRGSQPASQEINELKVSTCYQSKPLLFGDGKAMNISSGKTLGILDRFEEERRKAKENQLLTHGFRQLHENLDNIKRIFLNFVDGSCDDTKKAVAGGIDGLRKTIQDDLRVIKERITDQAEILVNLQNQTQKQIKDIEAKTTLAVKNLSSVMLSLQQDLGSLRIEQDKEQSVLGEILSLLGKMMASHSAGVNLRPVTMTDNTVQTSPGLLEKFCVVSEKKHYYDGLSLCCGGLTHQRIHQNLCPIEAKSPEKLNIDASYKVLGSVPVDKQQQQLLNLAPVEKSEHSVWQKSYCTRSVMTSTSSPPEVNTAVASDSQQCYMVGVPVHIEPEKLFVAMNENKFTTWTEEPRQKKVQKKAQRNQVFRRKKRALILPQRRPNNNTAPVNKFGNILHDKENMVPLSAVKINSTNHPPSTQLQGSARLTNRIECAQDMNPWSWSQSSSSSQTVVEYQKAPQETVITDHKTNTKVRKGGTWQLFDIISDSD